MVDGQALKKKVAWVWGMVMVMVGYAKIGNMGRNLYRVMTWHLLRG
jgi:hypothetical protein